MAETCERVGVPQVGVGSAFDLLSGRTRPTPAWMKERGLQWVHRLAQEPRRLAGRYALNNALFLWHIGQQLARRRRDGSADGPGAR
jgi:N-acetylglucosaminyldiphosphoundecaprenol N-acetyl-beta-D-mannosaminyltransferase